MAEAGYRYRFYPTREQAEILARTFGCARFAYNWALRLRSDAYQEQGKSLSYGDTSRRLTALKKTDEYAWLSEVSSVPVQQALRHLDAAYQKFFRKEAGFPRFKTKHGKEVVVIDRWYPSSKRCSSCGWINTALTLADRCWTCPACGAAHDRDANACLNILAVGHTVSASGLDVRPALVSASRAVEDEGRIHSFRRWSVNQRKNTRNVE